MSADGCIETKLYWVSVPLLHSFLLLVLQYSGVHFALVTLMQFANNYRFMTLTGKEVEIPKVSLPRTGMPLENE